MKKKKSTKKSVNSQHSISEAIEFSAYAEGAKFDVNTNDIVRPNCSAEAVNKQSQKMYIALVNSARKK